MKTSESPCEGVHDIFIPGRVRATLTSSVCSVQGGGREVNPEETRQRDCRDTVMRPQQPCTCSKDMGHKGCGTKESLGDRGGQARVCLPFDGRVRVVLRIGGGFRSRERAGREHLEHDHYILLYCVLYCTASLPHHARL